MNRQMMWTARRWPGCEHLDLTVDGDGVVADAVVLAYVEGAAVRLAYRIECDTAWNVRSVTIDVHRRARCVLHRDADGRWLEDGRERTDLTGCTDVDIALTPFTNTMPIRRLALRPGAVADLRVVYVRPAPALIIEPVVQRYTGLETGVRYESGTFRADLAVDVDGLVTDYPGVWAMVPSSSTPSGSQ